jgi:hypothetical protein
VAVAARGRGVADDLTGAPQPFTALGRVLAPLVLPLLVVIAAGTIESDWWVELVVGPSSSWSSGVLPCDTRSLV